MLAHILSAIVIRSEAVVYVSHSDASLQNHVSTRAPDCVISLHHDLWSVFVNLIKRTVLTQYTKIRTSRFDLEVEGWLNSRQRV